MRLRGIPPHFAWHRSWGSSASSAFRRSHRRCSSSSTGPPTGAPPCCPTVWRPPIQASPSSPSTARRSNPIPSSCRSIGDCRPLSSRPCSAPERARWLSISIYTKGTIQDADDRLQRALTAAEGKLILGAYENADALKEAQLAYQFAFLGKH